MVKLDNEREIINNISFIISDLANGIRTGYLYDGTKIDIIEFIKRVPFKNSKNFVDTISNFMSRNNIKDQDIIKAYIYRNRLNIKNTFVEIEPNNLYKLKSKINKISKEEIDMILDYLRNNNIPIITMTYFIMKDRYLKGELNTESNIKTK